MGKQKEIGVPGAEAEEMNKGKNSVVKSGKSMDKPVQKNEDYIIKIDSLGNDGEGVGRIGGFTVFVQGGLPGETLLIKIIKVTSSYAVGKLIEIKEPASCRRTPFCPVADKCGGCTLQHMDYDSQLKYKTQKVRDNLERIGKLTGFTLHETIGMGNPIAYRNKAQYPVGMEKGRVVMGFYAPRSHRVIDTKSCGIQHPVSDKITAAIRRWMGKFNIAAYDETTGKGIVRHVMVRVGYHTGEVMVVIVTNTEKFPKQEELVGELLKLKLDGNIGSATCADCNGSVQCSGQEACHGGQVIQGLAADEPVEQNGTMKITDKVSDESYFVPVSREEHGKSAESYRIVSIVQNINTKNTNVILGDKNVTLYGRSYIIDKIGDFEFSISPLSFFQVNSVQTKVLYEKALEYAQLTGSETVMDLYCGTGTISLFLSRKARKVYGIEVVPEAVEDARKNAERNRVQNVEFFAGEAENLVPELVEKGIRADVVVVDPPRKGCDQRLLETIVNMAPKRVVYVSCNPSTLARDLNYLSENGFEVREVQPVDMFPWTGHVECVVLMSRL